MKKTLCFGFCLLTFLSACSSTGTNASSNPQNPAGQTPQNPGTSNPNDPSFSLPSEQGDLRGIVDALPSVGEGSNGYLPPTSEQQASFRAGLQALLQGDEATASQALLSLQLKATHFTDTSGAVFILIREAAATPRGWGIVALRLLGARKLIIEAPHPGKDLYTENQAADLFLKLDAVALLVAGSDRCANADSSTCSGTTTVCSGGAAEPFRRSDAAHNLDSIYQMAHEVLLDEDSVLSAVALHGFSIQPGEPQAYLSNGTKVLGDASTPANRFAALLISTSGQSNAALSCNDGNPGLTLCGTTDTQGRYANQSVEACELAASTPTQRFIHLEQSLDLRTAGGAFFPGQVESVLKEMF